MTHFNPSFSQGHLLFHILYWTFGSSTSLFFFYKLHLLRRIPHNTSNMVKFKARFCIDLSKLISNHRSVAPICGVEVFVRPSTYHVSLSIHLDSRSNRYNFGGMCKIPCISTWFSTPSPSLLFPTSAPRFCRYSLLSSSIMIVIWLCSNSTTMLSVSTSHGLTFVSTSFRSTLKFVLNRTFAFWSYVMLMFLQLLYILLAWVRFLWPNVTDTKTSLICMHGQFWNIFLPT